MSNQDAKEDANTILTIENTILTIENKTNQSDDDENDQANQRRSSRTTNNKYKNVPSTKKRSYSCSQIKETQVGEFQQNESNPGIENEIDNGGELVKLLQNFSMNSTKLNSQSTSPLKLSTPPLSPSNSKGGEIPFSPAKEVDISTNSNDSSLLDSQNDLAKIIETLVNGFQ